MIDIDANKIALIDQAIGWLQNAKKYHAAWQHQVASDCLLRAKSVLNDPAFLRQPIPGYARNQTPEVVWVKNPLTNGKMLINGVDYDPAVHQIWEEPVPTSAKRTR